ncbi:16537_t:CDS:2, partial [Funneliformis caledonium]
SLPKQFSTRRPFKDYYNLDTEKDNYTKLYSANSNDQIRSHRIFNQLSPLIQFYPTTILTSPTESSSVSNKEVTSEHVSDMCEEMKIMFI